MLNSLSFGRALRRAVGDAFVSYALKDRVLKRERKEIFANINMAPVCVVDRALFRKDGVPSLGIKVFALRLLM